MSLKKSLLAAAVALPLSCADPYGVHAPQIMDLSLFRNPYSGAVILEAVTSPAADACGYALNQRGYVPHDRLRPFGSGYGNVHRTLITRSPVPVSIDVTAECARRDERSAQVYRRLYSR